MIGLKTKLADLWLRLIARLLRPAVDEIMGQRSREMDVRNEERSTAIWTAFSDATRSQPALRS